MQVATVVGRNRIGVGSIAQHVALASVDEDAPEVVDDLLRELEGISQGPNEILATWDAEGEPLALDKLSGPELEREYLEAHGHWLTVRGIVATLDGPLRSFLLDVVGRRAPERLEKLLELLQGSVAGYRIVSDRFDVLVEAYEDEIDGRRLADLDPNDINNDGELLSREQVFRK
jgi:hypothetical protein